MSPHPTAQRSGQPRSRPSGRPLRSPWLPLVVAFLALASVVPAAFVAVWTSISLSVPGAVDVEKSPTSLQVVPDTEYVVWKNEADAFGCEVEVTGGAGSAQEAVPVRPGGTSLAWGGTAGQWRAHGTFTPTTDRVDVGCVAGSQRGDLRLQVSPEPGVSGWAAIWWPVLFPVAAILVAVLALAMTILRVRARRNTSAQPGTELS